MPINMEPLKGMGLQSLASTATSSGQKEGARRRKIFWRDRVAQLKLSGSLLARNTMLNFIGQAVPFLVGVATIPFIVKGLGTERFGLLALAWVILGHFTIFDLGLGRATIKFVAEALGKGEEDQVPCLVWTAVTVQAVLGIVGTLVLIGITPLLVERILNITSELVSEAKATFYLLALSVLVVLVSSSFRGVLEASQRFDLVNATKIPSNTLTFLLPLFGLWLGFRLPGIVVLILLARVGALVAFVALNLRIMPQLRRYSGSFSLFPRLFFFGGWITVSSIAGPILRYLDRFLIGSLITMTAVAYYTAPFEVITRLWIIPSSLVMTLFPAFSTLRTTRKEDLQELYIRSIKYLLLSTGPIVVTLVVFADNILRVWLGADFAKQSTLVFQILLLGTLIGLLAPVSGALLQGLGRPDVLAKLYLVEVPLNMVLVWFLVQHLGIVGASLSFALRTLIETGVLFVISARLIHISYTCVIENGLWRSIVVLVGVSGLFWLVSLTKMVLFKIGSITVLILAFVVISWRYVLDETDKKTIGSITPRLLFPKGGQ
jgi:O-antigen/teichoic acid export membrane protein